MMRLTPDASRVIVYAGRLAQSRGIRLISSQEILAAIIGLGDDLSESISELGLEFSKLCDVLEMDPGVISAPVEKSELDAYLQYFRVETKRLFAQTNQLVERHGDPGITPAHILFTLTHSRNYTAYNILISAGIDIDELNEVLTNIMSESSRDNNEDSISLGGNMPGGDMPVNRNEQKNRTRGKSKTKALDEFGKNLTELAKNGKIDPVIGREEEINRVMQILARRTKNNPCLVGDPGVGKTAIAEGLALKIAQNDVPDIIKDKRVYSIDMGTMVAGTKYRGDFEERIKNVLTEATEDPDVILFIDELHTLIGTGGGDSSLDAANILKPMLTKNELRIVGATTLDEYSKFIEKDSALERRFQKVIVNEPSVMDAIEILKGLRHKYEEHHKIRIMDDAIEQAVILSTRYLSDRFLPDKAIDLIDEAAARKRINFADIDARKKLEAKISKLQDDKAVASEKEDFETCIAIKGEIEKLEDMLNSMTTKVQPDEEGFTGTLTVDDVADVLSRWSGIPVSKITESDAERLKNLEDELKKRVVGQDEAVTAISKAIRRSRLGLKDPSKPSGSFIFLGTTGVGKTELAKALAEVMFGDENALVRIDMSEYMEKHDVSKLIGSPPGYVGYDEGGQLTEKVRRHPYSVVLFDEIEKAHPDIFNSMLQLLDDGRLTDGKGRVVDFKNTIIIMTSNIGARMLTSAQGRRIGFATSDEKDDDEASREGLYGGKSYDDAKEVVIDELKKAFTPEFVNRVDEILFFRMLSRESLIKIVDILSASVAKRIKDIGIEIKLTDNARELLAKKGYDPQYGARPLRRVIQSMVEDNLSEALLDGVIRSGSIALIDAKDDEIVITNAGQIEPLKVETVEDNKAKATE